MNAWQVKQLIIDQIEATTPPSGVLHHADTFISDDRANTGHGSRVFRVALATTPAMSGRLPLQIGSAQIAPHQCVFMLEVMYHQEQEREALEDAPAIVTALVNLHAATANQVNYSGKLMRIDVAGASVDLIQIGNEPATEPYLVLRWEITCTYDSR